MTIGATRSAMTDATALTVPLMVRPGLSGRRQPVRFGVPLAKSALRRIPTMAWVESSQGDWCAAQTEPLAYWSDDSVKWLRIDAEIIPALDEGTQWRLTLHSSWTDGRPAESKSASLNAAVACGPVRLSTDSRALSEHGLKDIVLGARLWHIRDRRGRLHLPSLDAPELVASGPVSTTLRQTGRFSHIRGLNLVVEWSIYGDAGLLRGDVTIHNSRRARHRGGLWDLGDAGSILLKDFSLRWPLERLQCKSLTLQISPGSPPLVASRKCKVFQASSGGEHWQSRVHVNRHGDVPCPFRGYRASADDREETGHRATPQTIAHGEAYRVTLAAAEFWEQFPKTLQGDANQMRLGLFPEEFGDLYELQGGERKRYTFWLQFTEPSEIGDLAWVFDPTIVAPAAEACIEARVTPEVRPQPSEARDNLERLLDEALKGPRSLFASRERVDEYGWRHFGDMLADHEAVYYRGDAPFVSHYNNQFDVLLGLLYQFLRSGDLRWYRFADELARHVIDVDVYHTSEDRAAYNGGQFWFTDHYLTAHESTHRTYSRKNAPPTGDYGGGPGSEHNYTTGLLLYHFLTGCMWARATVIELADWVIGMEDGRRSFVRVFDDGPTGLATAKHAKPGRGGANSINVLVDAWTLTRDAKYLALCEVLIRRCIHPADDVDKGDLLNVEENWSYTMFLTSLAKYAAAKEEAEQIDACYQLATASLLHYAEWMLQCELPYFDQADRLEYPTETWAAQEFRKANVFRRAAKYAGSELAARLRAKGDEFGNRAWRDLMRFSETRATIRPLALAMTEGLADCVYRHERETPRPIRPGIHPVLGREPFIAQQQRVLAMARSPSGAVTLMRRLFDPRRWPRRS